ncbi:MAG: hypothetical protein Q8P57_01050 [Candidatus Pacearchaeota archaeon]|nr:hypothetical protein [Candidatus Pacearchaeota archaeon]
MNNDKKVEGNKKVEDKKAVNIEEKLVEIILTPRSILEKSGREYYLSGKDELNKERYNSALVLFFKALLSFCDLYLLKETGKAPNSHNDRFRIIKKDFLDIYEIIDKDFPFYIESYGKIISKDNAEAIKHHAETMATKAEIKL